MNCIVIPFNTSFMFPFPFLSGIDAAPFCCKLADCPCLLSHHSPCPFPLPLPWSCPWTPPWPWLHTYPWLHILVLIAFLVLIATLVLIPHLSLSLHAFVVDYLVINLQEEITIRFWLITIRQIWTIQQCLSNCKKVNLKLDWYYWH